MGRRSKDVMTSEPRTIDAGESVAYTAKWLRVTIEQQVRDAKQTRALVEEISH